MKHFTLPKEGGLVEKNIPSDILHSYEKIRTEIYDQSTTASEVIADEIIDSINACQGRTFKLGLSTGVTPVSLYKWLTRKYQEGKVSFSNVEVYSIDEYYPYGKGEPQSRNSILHNSLLNAVDIKEENIHIPDGSVPEDKITAYCEEYDKMVRGLDMLVIGMGEMAQVGFNEAGTSPVSRTRTVLLSYQSRKRQGKNFNGDFKHTPSQAITIGIDTMMSAKRIVLMAWGEDKANAVKHVCECNPDYEYPASLLQGHQNICCYVDVTAL